MDFANHRPPEETSEMFTRQNSPGRVFPRCPRREGGASDPHPPIHRVPSESPSFHPDPANPDGLTGSAQTRQAPMSHRSSLLALLSAAGLCWADEESGDLIGSRDRGVPPLNLEQLYELILLRKGLLEIAWVILQLRYVPQSQDTRDRASRLQLAGRDIPEGFGLPQPEMRSALRAAAASHARRLPHRPAGATPPPWRRWVTFPGRVPQAQDTAADRITQHHPLDFQKNRYLPAGAGGPRARGDISRRVPPII